MSKSRRKKYTEALNFSIYLVVFSIVQNKRKRIRKIQQLNYEGINMNKHMRILT